MDPFTIFCIIVLSALAAMVVATTFVIGNEVGGPYVFTPALPPPIPHKSLKGRKTMTDVKLTKNWLDECDTVEKLREEYEKRLDLSCHSKEVYIGRLKFYIRTEDLQKMLETARMSRVLMEREIKGRIDVSKLKCIRCGKPLSLLFGYECVYIECWNHSCKTYNNAVELADIYWHSGSLDAVDEVVEEAVQSIKEYFTNVDIVKEQP